MYTNEWQVDENLEFEEPVVSEGTSKKRKNKEKVEDHVTFFLLRQAI